MAHFQRSCYQGQDSNIALSRSLSSLEGGTFMANFKRQKQHIQGNQINVAGDQHQHINYNYPTPSTQTTGSNYPFSSKPITAGDWMDIIEKGAVVAGGTAFSISIVASCPLLMLWDEHSMLLLWCIICGIICIALLFGIIAGKKKLRQIIILKEKGLCVKCEGRGRVPCPKSGENDHNQGTCPTCNGGGFITCPKCLGTQARCAKTLMVCFASDRRQKGEKRAAFR